MVSQKALQQSNKLERIGDSMKTIKISANDKVLFLLRGLPGSGKSFLSKQLAGETGVVYSTDDFFINKETGKYEFDPKKIGYNHKRNYERTVEALEKGISPIVVDNTFTQSWEGKNYALAAQKYGYKIEIKEPSTEWAWNVEELAKRNSHGVPAEAIQRMKDRYQKDLTVDQIVNSKNPFEK